jgi:hypothetical protein
MGLEAGVGFYNRAICRSELGDSKGAASDYKEACRLDPEFAKEKLPGPIKVGFAATIEEISKSIEKAIADIRNGLMHSVRH